MTDASSDRMPARANDQIDPASSLHESILVRLREYLAGDALQDGDRVPERALCEMLAVSRTPLREALKVLAAEGLIDLLPNRGARVRALSAVEVEELFDLIGGLEALAGRLAAERMSDAEFAEIEALHHEMYASYLRRDIAAYAQANRSIHSAIVAAAANQSLSAAYRRVSDRVSRTRYSGRLTEDRDRLSESLRDHEDILDQLRRRDGAALADTLFRHLRHKQDAALETLGIHSQ